MRSLAAQSTSETVDINLLRRERFTLRYTAFVMFVASADFVASIVAALLAHHAYLVAAPGSFGFHSFVSALGIGTVAGLPYVLLNKGSGLYSLSTLQHGERYALSGMLNAVVAMLLLVAFLFVIRAGADISRGTFLFFTPLQQGLLLFNRFASARATRKLLARRALVGPTAVVLGDASQLRGLTEMTLMSEFGLKEIGRVAIDVPSPADWESAIEDALLLSRRRGAEKLVLALQWDDRERLDRVRQALRRSALPTLLLPDSTVRRVTGECLGLPGRSTARAIILKRAPMHIGMLALKRTLDIILGLAAILALFPIMILATIAIKIDSPGPVIFRQRRHGFDRRPFSIFKFRSMRVLEDGGVIPQATRNDARVTRVGAILRRTSIDELPQLFNVLLGHMSLVGPRPHAIAHDETYVSVIERYCFRHHVKPGITGWAQINGARGQTSTVQQMADRVAYDLWYIDHCSPWLDLVILARTCLAVMKSDAY